MRAISSQFAQNHYYNRDYDRIVSPKRGWVWSTELEKSNDFRIKNSSYIFCRSYAADWSRTKFAESPLRNNLSTDKQNKRISPKEMLKD